jgi:hypothetical protein
MKRFLLATTLAASIFGAPAYADLPVIDTSALLQWAKQLQSDAQQVQAAINTLTQIEQEVRDVEDIPQGLMSQVTGLINQATQNPLTGITGNLGGLLNGSGTGQCANSANLLHLNQFATANGGDFTGSSINGMASITAGLQACNQMVLQSTQNSLADLPQLGQQLQACKDVACATAVSGRIQVETANLNAQSVQLTAMVNAGQLQQFTSQQQFVQKMRADSEAVANGTTGQGRATGTTNVPNTLTDTTQAPVFTADTFGD